MSNIGICERGIVVEDFFRELAAESANIILNKIPEEYRSVYLGSYAAGLLLSQDNSQEKVRYV